VYISKKRSQFSKAKEGKEETGLVNKQKSTSIGNINSRLNHIEKEMEGLKKDNEKLQDELDSKIKELIKVKASNQEMELKLSLITEVKTNEQNKDSALVVSMPKGMLKEIAKPTQNKP
jgi:predicted transcriptional regulator